MKVVLSKFQFFIETNNERLSKVIESMIVSTRPFFHNTKLFLFHYFMKIFHSMRDLQSINLSKEKRKEKKKDLKTLLFILKNGTKRRQKYEDISTFQHLKRTQIYKVNCLKSLEIHLNLNCFHRSHRRDQHQCINVLLIYFWPKIEVLGNLKFCSHSTKKSFLLSCFWVSFQVFIRVQGTTNRLLWWNLGWMNLNFVSLWIKKKKIDKSYEFSHKEDEQKDRKILLFFLLQIYIIFNSNSLPFLHSIFSSFCLLFFLLLLFAICLLSLKSPSVELFRKTQNSRDFILKAGMNDKVIYDHQECHFGALENRILQLICNDDDIFHSTE